MASANYALFARAMKQRQQVLCFYDDFRRELCPIILGHTRTGDEAALTFQFGGESSGRLPSEGAWRCLSLAKVSDVELRDGPWRSGPAHRHAQHCVDRVDLDVNPSSPYRPARRL